MAEISVAQYSDVEEKIESCKSVCFLLIHHPSTGLIITSYVGTTTGC